MCGFVPDWKGVGRAAAKFGIAINWVLSLRQGYILALPPSMSDGGNVGGSVAGAPLIGKNFTMPKAGSNTQGMPGTAWILARQIC